MTMTKRIALAVLIPMMLLLGTGCLPAWVAASSGLGFLLGQGSVQSTTMQECFLNGEPIDCSALQ
jgi:hypothetical protein